MPKTEDLTGRTFGRLTVLGPTSDPRPGNWWKCSCTCGAEKVAPGHNLRNGKCQSCGCRSREMTGNRARSHGHSKTKLYGVWKSMRNRCQKPSVSTYGLYGGRGISVCAEWETFATFKGWADGAGYAAGLTIERKDNDGDYCPDNCCWISQREQSHNTRAVKRNSEGKAWVAVALENGISGPAFNSRIGIGWPPEKAATWPVGEPTEEYLNRPRDSAGRFAG